MRRMKLHGIVEYLKSRSVDFYHDTFDLGEEGVEGILNDYEIYEHFSDEELQELRKDLYELAEKNEFRKAVISAANTEVIEGMRMLEVM